MVGCIKRPLRKIIGTNLPRFRELESILSEIELCVNLRPMTALPSGDCEVRALCPADLVNGYNARSRFPDVSMTNLKINNRDLPIIMTKTWKRQEAVMKAFWKRFRLEYLGQLRNAVETKPATPHVLNVGDVCLMADPSPSRGYWPLCKVVNVFGGERTDLRKRSCMVMRGDGKILKRPIHSIYPLGISQAEEASKAL